MLRILQTLFFAERGFALLLDVMFAIVLLVFYEAHKRQKAGLKNPAYFIF